LFKLILKFKFQIAIAKTIKKQFEINLINFKLQKTPKKKKKKKKKI